MSNHTAEIPAGPCTDRVRADQIHCGDIIAKHGFVVDVEFHSGVHQGVRLELDFVVVTFESGVQVEYPTNRGINVWRTADVTIHITADDWDGPLA